MHRFFTIYLFILIISLTAVHATLYGGVDVRSAFIQARNKIDQEVSWKAQTQLSRQYVILFAPGFLSNSFTETFIEFCRKSDLPSWMKKGLETFLPKHIKNFRLGSYYQDQIYFLRIHGIEAYLLKYESEAGPRENAINILTQLLARTQRKKAILISHSKGGVDTGVAFCAWMRLQLGSSPASSKEREFLQHIKRVISSDGHIIQLEERVSAWIAQGSAFRGSPIADAIVNKSWMLSKLAYGMLRFLGGSEKSLKSLVQSTREAWIKKNALFLRNVVRTIPTLSISTYKINPHGLYSIREAILSFRLVQYFDTFLAPLRNAMYDLSIKSDGLVPWKNAIIDGSDYVVFPDMDHAALVMNNLFDNIDRIRFLKILLQMMLDKKRL